MYLNVSLKYMCIFQLIHTLIIQMVPYCFFISLHHEHNIFKECVQLKHYYI